MTSSENDDVVVAVSLVINFEPFFILVSDKIFKYRNNVDVSIVSSDV